MLWNILFYVIDILKINTKELITTQIKKEQDRHLPNNLIDFGYNTWINDKKNVKVNLKF